VDLNGSKDCGNLSDIVTITITGSGQPFLGQNYPNPFIETTVIPFSLPEKAVVTLEVLDIFGNVLKTIVDGELNAATYNNYQWDRQCNDGTYAPNGTYLYRLTAGDVVKTGKMTLIR